MLYAVVHKELFTFFSSKFTIEVPGPGFLEVEGDYTDHEYTFARNGQVGGRGVESLVHLGGNLRRQRRGWGRRPADPGVHGGDEQTCRESQR